ncbi:MAG: endo-1,4-beta-xylanase [Beijerinckiaceae bacterium]
MRSSHPSRRAALAGLGAGAAATLLPSQDARAQRNAIRYGVAAMKENFNEDPLYRDALVKYCDIIVPMNDLKWEALRPARGQFNYTDADRTIQFAQSNGKSVRGHTLCWYNALPNWVKSITTAREAEAELRNHIEQVVDNYRGKIPSWDVVNEAISHDTAKQGVWRDTFWQKLLGERHIEIAFATAAKADPKAQLVYNDYDLENTGERESLRRQHTLALVRRLKDKNIPIHAVGFQAHLYAERTIDPDGIARFVKDLRALDVAVLVTELDLIDWRLPAATAERDAAAARHVKTFLSALSDAGPVDSIITWGITDRYSWIPEHFKRRDGLPNRPLPLDQNYKPKPFMDVISSFRAGLG